MKEKLYIHLLEERVELLEEEVYDLECELDEQSDLQYLYDELEDVECDEEVIVIDNLDDLIELLEEVRDEEPKKTLSDINTLEVGDMIVSKYYAKYVIVKKFIGTIKVAPYNLVVDDGDCFEINYIDLEEDWWKLKEEDEVCIWFDNWCCCDWCFDERMALHEEYLNTWYKTT